MSVLQVDKIQDAAGTTNKELAQYASGNWGWGAGVPNGTIINSGIKIYTGGDHSIAGATDYEAIINYMSVSCTVGNIIFFGWNNYLQAYRSANQPAGRIGYIDLYQSTSSVSAGATSSLGTKVNRRVFGRNTGADATAASTSYSPMHLLGAFEATATTHYLGPAFRADSANMTTVSVMSSTYPAYLYFHEIKGDVLT